jgi:4-hydroxy-tetrahydrodipicolinate synthase
VGGFKTAMRRLGLISTNLMARPQRSLNDEEAARVEAILRATDLLG